MKALTVVVPRWDADAAEMVLEMNAGESEVGDRSDRGVCSVVWVARHHGLHLRHGRLIHSSRRLDIAWHTRVLRHAEAAAGVGRWRTGVEAVSRIMAALSHLVCWLGVWDVCVC